jgi:catechol 2,3-dioxygenase-like lactoylglutathione lyase family enzyme
MGRKTVLATLIAAVTVLSGIAYTQQPPKPGKMTGLAFESLTVSNLEKSINYYKALGFTVEAESPWVRDEAENRLYSTPGATSRTAKMSIDSTVSGKPFALYLREYKSLDRGRRVDFPARHPSSSHIGLTVPEADALWERLKSAGLLRALSWDEKLVRMPGQTSGGIAYVRDLDGFNIEIIGVNQGPGAAAGGRKPSLHHLGLSILNSGKSIGFYGSLLGGKFPDSPPRWLSGNMYDAAVGGHGYFINLINGVFPEAGAPQSEMRFELVEYRKPDRQDVDDYKVSDVSVNCVGIQVEDLESLCAKLSAAGVKTRSGPGTVQKKDGTRAVLVRDPDVGAFVELFEKK